MLPLIVVGKEGTSLCAIDWIHAFKLDMNALIYAGSTMVLSSTSDCNMVSKCENNLQKVLDKFPAVFAPGLGHCTKMKARLILKDDAAPKSFKPRTVPFGRYTPSTRNSAALKKWELSPM